MPIGARARAAGKAASGRIYTLRQACDNKSRGGARCETKTGSRLAAAPRSGRDAAR
ncbi:hypothetical protein GCM10011390_27610 [Aureimonas endophytica]|uniref:Uncharacterized protein n=1 Tax=Aureimonas endophytica TaxID=2027858 RepID=A0A916ZQD4_9HYPH|nr:hypothetical protein GCM10011390_27610 [Aureimonas endophytica]